ncbi:hypothetical protein DY367_12205 [Achromobacter xylosoxidans]|uniref:Uncharacterized protein n=1 Tax=Alcaligenes xylosoxydans xylosoxydans TaxID=85698 RepID=A0A424WE73_ALCXX|nr:hypothetical protein DY367_12205 [Achromobacter xylosoxidans]
MRAFDDRTCACP